MRVECHIFCLTHEKLVSLLRVSNVQRLFYSIFSSHSKCCAASDSQRKLLKDIDPFIACLSKLTTRSFLHNILLFIEMP